MSNPYNYMPAKKKKSGFVYGIETTRKDGSKKIYVGKTGNLKRRKKQHGV